MIPNRALKDRGDIEATGMIGFRTQSPSTLGRRLRVELRHTCRSGKMIDWSAPLDLTDPVAAGPLPGRAFIRRSDSWPSQD
jgi:hypothetical protein